MEDPRRRAHRRRRDGRRARAGRVLPRVRVCAGARAVRAADRELPGGAARRPPTWRRRSRPAVSSSTAPPGSRTRGGRSCLAAAQAKLYTGLLSNRAANAALQIHGGYGFMHESRSRGSSATRRSSRSAKARTRPAHGDREATRPVGPQTGHDPGVLVAHAAWTAPPSVFIATGIAAALFAQGWLRLRGGAAAPTSPAVEPRRALRGRGRRRGVRRARLADRSDWRAVPALRPHAPARAHRRCRSRAADRPDCAARCSFFLLPARVLGPVAREPLTHRASSRSCCGRAVAFAPLGAEPRHLAHPAALRSPRCTHPLPARPRARLLDARRPARVDAPDRPRQPRTAHRRRPHRAGSRHVRRRPGAHRRARLLVPPALSVRTAAPTGSLRAPTSSSRAS